MGWLWELVLEDRNVVFADWGVTVSFRVISQTYDAARMVTLNSTADTSIQGLIEKLPDRPTQASGGVFLKRELTLIVKNEDVPGGEVLLTHRIVYDGHAYEIQIAEKSVDGAVTRLECREI